MNGRGFTKNSAERKRVWFAGKKMVINIFKNRNPGFG
jgi:hypothetical protein